MNTTEYFKRTIQAYLEERAMEDELFAAKYDTPDKNIDDCVTRCVTEIPPNAPHRERKQKYTNHHYSTRYETKNEISEASRNLKQGVTTYQGSANAMGIP